MSIRTLPQARATILGTITMVIVAVAVPLMVHAQGATPQASPAASATDQLISRGDEIFHTVCIACHQPDGKGIEGIYLPLAGNPAITQDDPTYFITTVLNGRGGMPRFDTTFSDADIASITTYVRQAFGNDAPPVSPDQVAAVRAEYLPTTPTPEGQIPAGSGREGAEQATPQASPAATPGA